MTERKQKILRGIAFFPWDKLFYNLAWRQYLMK